MLRTQETSAVEVYAHAADHGDRPVIHGAEIDYDDVHDGVHYHANLLTAAHQRVDALREKRDNAAVSLAIHIDVFEASGRSPRSTARYRNVLADFRRLDAELNAARDQRDALQAKADQDAAMATYEVSA